MAGLKLTNGFVKTTYWTIKEIESHRDKYSQSYKSAIKYGKKDAVWITNFDGMAKKTVIKDLISKYSPMNTEMQEAIKIDQAVVLTNPENGDEDIIYPDNPASEENIVETISSEQQEALARVIGNNQSRLGIFEDAGYKVPADVPIAEYETILAKIKAV
jgi:recombination protein RecT